MVSLSVCLFLQLFPGSQWGTDLEEDHLVRGAVCLALDMQISSKIANQFTFYQLCKDGGNLTKLDL